MSNNARSGQRVQVEASRFRPGDVITEKPLTTDEVKCQAPMPRPERAGTSS
jgi:hypothetical protein